MSAGVVIVPWYATGFRGDAFEEPLRHAAHAAMRYGATSYAVYRARDDRYKYQHFTTWEEHLDWERYWEGPEMTLFRARHAGWYQVPVLYGWWDLAVSGAVGQEPVAIGNGGPAEAESA
jgi:hypothetical protein